MKKIILFICLFSASLLSAKLHKIDCYCERFDRVKKQQEHSSSTGHTTSTNWSGYASAASFVTEDIDSVSYVTGDWTVPTLNPQKGKTYCSFWVGIDGFLNSTVEQIGTEHDYRKGRQVNYAWFEMYPRGAYKIVGFPVRPGDHISASVNYLGDDVFELTISNLTRNVTTTIPTSYTKNQDARRSSAEWILEAPFSGKVLPLSDFSIGHFSACTATINGISGPINHDTWQNDSISMQKGSITKAEPSSLDGTGQIFEVVWKHR